MCVISLLSCLLGCLLLDSCNRDNLLPTNPDLISTWQLYEEGGSPGFGYYVNPVPTSPQQSLTFAKSGNVRLQGDRLSIFSAYPYYRYDVQSNGPRLQFLKTRKDTTGYAVGCQLKGDSLRIVPLCYEGCHFGFVRIR
jgi:hypothetical protein